VRRLLIFLILLVTAVARATPPLAPVIIEPVVAGQVVHFADVHMATEPFADPDPGDAHRCTDWELWTVTPSERVWSTACLTDASLRVHAHLGDGTFEGSRAGLLELAPDTEHVLRVRHHDLSDTPGPFAERAFRTSAATVVSPLDLDDVRTTPAPAWVDAGGEAIVPGDGALRLESPAGELLLGLIGALVMAPPPLDHHVALRVLLEGPLVVPTSRLTFTSGDGVARTVYLPAVVLADGEQRFLWVALNGSTFDAQAGQTSPDFSSLVQGAAVPWTALPGYVVEVVASGFQLPVNIAFVPAPGPEADAPLYYVSELYGSIKVVGRDGSVRNYATGLLNFDPLASIPGNGERGLTGVVVEPSTGDVLASLLVSQDPTKADAPLHPRVIRMTSADGGRTAGMPTIVLDMPDEVQGPSHQISQLTFGPDGMLYVHMGEGFFYWLARDLTSLRGKILRITPDGAPAPGNPYYVEGDGFTARDYIFASGFRNPFGGAWRAVDQHLYEVENGPNTDRFARVISGMDYGWEGPDETMLIGALYNWFPPAAPVSLAWVQPETFGGSGFPASQMGRAFVTLSGPTWASGPIDYAKRIVALELDEDGLLVSGPTPVVVYDGLGKATAGGMAAGPDGLYFTDIYRDLGYAFPTDVGAQVLRVRFVGAADFTADVRHGPAPLTVQLTDTSTVPGATGWAWDFGDGTSSTEQHPVHTWDADGRYDVRLRVTGPAGISVLRREQYVRVSSTETDLVVSTSPSRAEPVLLDGGVVTGDIYVFTDPVVGVASVEFRVDGVVTRTEVQAPFDLGGTGVPGALPYSTTALAEGPHVVTALVTFSGGGSEQVVAHVEVDNDACGSGTTTLGEECDDGNVAAGDCCSPTCQREDDGAACSDGDTCTVGDVCHAGLCDGTPIECTGLDTACRVGTCTGSGCASMPRDDGTTCDDGDACTDGDACSNGVCGGNAVTCDDGVTCTTDACTESGCSHVGVPDCCNDDADCNDGNACTGAETCVAGTCMSGTPLVCADDVGCTVDGCDPAIGCVVLESTGCCAPGASCDDGDACTGVETCDTSSGSCQAGTPISCDDGDACTVDRCEGGCVSDRLDVDDATAALTEPVIAGCERTPAAVKQALQRARHRLERARIARAPKRRAQLLARAKHDVERAQRRTIRRGMPDACTAGVESLGALLACVH
jgi:PKD repeat protein